MNLHQCKPSLDSDDVAEKGINNKGMGPFKCYVTQWGLSAFAKKCYEGVRFNDISITRGLDGSQIPRKKALCNTSIAPMKVCLRAVPLARPRVPLTRQVSCEDVVVSCCAGDPVVATAELRRPRLSPRHFACNTLSYCQDNTHIVSICHIYTQHYTQQKVG